MDSPLHCNAAFSCTALLQTPTQAVPGKTSCWFSCDFLRKIKGFHRLAYLKRMTHPMGRVPPPTRCPGPWNIYVTGYRFRDPFPPSTARGGTQIHGQTPGWALLLLLLGLLLLR